MDSALDIKETQEQLLEEPRLIQSLSGARKENTKEEEMFLHWATEVTGLLIAVDLRVHTFCPQFK